jgi:phage terminase large subunit GpA-like protein
MKTAALRVRRAAGLYSPPPRLSLSEWADTYRRTSREASAVVGKWVTRPYQKEPLDAFTDSRVKCIVVMSAVQMLKTEAILNAIGYVIHLDPGPMLVLQYRDTDCEIFSKRRLAPMLRDTPILRGLISDSKGRSAGNTITDKTFPGGHLRIAASASPGNVAALPIRYLFCDEVDKYPASAAAEGDPVSLAEGRLTEFEYNYKEILTCSPTVAGKSRIEKAFLESDRREFFVPCPKCGHRQFLKWSQVKFDTSLPSLKKQSDSAVYVCEACNAEWNDVERWKAVDQGAYQATAPFTGIAGFRISSLCSQKKTLGKIVGKFLRAQGDIERLKTFFNTELAETWVEQGEAPEWERLLERREKYTAGIVPRGGLFLVCGVDVHPDRIEAEIVAFGRGYESWSIDYQILEGQTTAENLRVKLEGLLAEVFPSETGADMPIIRMFVDSGNQTSTVYQAVRSLPASRCVAVKGVQRSTIPVGQPAPQDVTIGGRKIKGGLKIRTVWVDFFKGQLYADLKKRAPTPEEQQQGWSYPPGFCHFPEGKNYGDEHFKQLCAEQLVTRTDRKGRSKREWEQTRPRNEALDCRVYARAAAWDVGMDRFQERHWRTLESNLKLDPPAPQPPAPAPLASSNEAVPQPPQPAQPQQRPTASILGPRRMNIRLR